MADQRKIEVDAEFLWELLDEFGDSINRDEMYFASEARRYLGIPTDTEA